MTPDQLTPDEKYVEQERLTILCADGVPTEAMIELAEGDVRRFGEEMKEQNDTN